MEKENQELGRRVRFVRELQGFSQEAIALYLGISQQAYQKLESGKCRICEFRLKKIAGFLGVKEVHLTHFDKEKILMEFRKEELRSFKSRLKEELLSVQSELKILRELNQRLMEQLEQE